MENQLISIIVPIYNVEKYLKKCIESIINQTYKNIEIILVDDGSPDNCGIICDEYSQKDKRIIVIHKENGGLSDARNKGIDIAKGDYLTFIDSDDFVNIDYIEKLYNSIKLNNTKLAQCGISKVNENNEIIEKLNYDENYIKTSHEILNELYGKHLIENVVVWNKMYAKELFKNIRFAVGKIHEDEFTTYKLIYYSKNVAIVSDSLYNYRQNNASIMGRKFNIKRLNLLEALEQRIQFFWDKNEKDLYEKSVKVYLEQLRMYYIKTKKYIRNSKEIQQDIKRKYKIEYKKFMKVKEKTFKQMLKGKIFYFCPDLYYIIKKNKF